VSDLHGIPAVPVYVGRLNDPLISRRAAPPGSASSSAAIAGATSSPPPVAASPPMRVADAGPVAAALRNERSTAIATSTTPRSESRARSVASMSLSAFPSPGFVCEPARLVSKSVRPLRPSAVVVRPDRSAPFGEDLEVIVVSVSRDGPSRSAGPLSVGTSSGSQRLKRTLPIIVSENQIDSSRRNARSKSTDRSGIGPSAKPEELSPPAVRFR